MMKSKLYYRKIFRAKSIKNNKMCFGDLITHSNQPNKVFICNGNLKAEVYPETVSQFTGVKDYGGENIFENDTVIIYDKENNISWESVVQEHGYVDFLPDYDEKYEGTLLSWLGDNYIITIKGLKYATETY